MKVGLIDVDGHNYPNMALMKISAWHKMLGDDVGWYDPLMSGEKDRVYLSKVFSFSSDFVWPIKSDEIIKGGTGYAIKNKNGKEVFEKQKHKDLPDEIEHMMPDYGLYGIKDTAYGFLSRGCPRNCDFCHVGAKEGCKSRKVANLSEFWSGQKQIVICDPNLLACKDWEDMIGQLIESKAWVDINQGLDMRLMTDYTARMIKKIKAKNLHFAWDKMDEYKKIVDKFRMFKEETGINYRKLGVYVLTGFDTTLDEDLFRVYTLRDLGYSPYVMIYQKDKLPKKHILRDLQRWVNNKIIFAKCKTFEEYKRAA